MRRYIYFLEFIKNLFEYGFQKIKLKKIQVWVGQTCTLKCKNCSQLFPYIKHRIYDINTVISELEYALKFIEPEEIHIIGGEPFTNPNIDSLINYIASVNPNKNNKIISNGTIIPSEKVLESLSKNASSFFIAVSDYPVAAKRQEEFVNKLKDIIKIKFIENENWYYLGNNTQEEIKGDKNLQSNFEACWDRTCHTIADGKLSICPRMHNSPLVFKNENKMFIEHLQIKNIPNNFIGRALVATCLTQKTYREACRHCYGVSNRNNLFCEKAEQLVESGKIL